MVHRFVDAQWSTGGADDAYGVEGYFKGGEQESVNNLYEQKRWGGLT